MLNKVKAWGHFFSLSLFAKSYLCIFKHYKASHYQLSLDTSSISCDNFNMFNQASHFAFEPVREKTNNFGSEQVRHKPDCKVTEDG